MKKKDLLKKVVKQVDATKYDSTPIIDSMREMSFTSRDTARAADIFKMMMEDKDCTTILTLAGSTSAGGCMNVYADMIKYNMIDAVVATGASIVDMDFFEALGFKHYQGTPFIDDHMLRKNYIDRIYDTYIDEEQLQNCDSTIKKIADDLEPRPYSSREFIREMGRYLTKNAKKKNSLVELAFKHDVPIFCPGVLRLQRRLRPGDAPVREPQGARVHRLGQGLLRADRDQDGRQDLRPVHGRRRGPEELRPGHRGLRRVPGKDVPMHQYAVQITVADVRDGACSSSTLKEASSWGKVADHLRADGVRRGDHGRAADLQLRLPQRRPQEADRGTRGPRCSTSDRGPGRRPHFLFYILYI